MNKSMKPTAAPARQMTDEEKKIQVIKFLQQKRESFSLNILCNLCQGQAKLILDRFDEYKGDKIKTLKKVIKDSEELIGLDGMILVEMSVKMADHLIEKLYPLPEEKTGE